MDKPNVINYIGTDYLSEVLKIEVVSFEIEAIGQSTTTDASDARILRIHVDTKEEGKVKLIAKRTTEDWGRREFILYQEILSQSKIPVPQLYDFIYEETTGYYWLLMEEAGEPFECGQVVIKNWIPWTDQIFELLALIHTEFVGDETLPTRYSWLAKDHELGNYPIYPDGYESKMGFQDKLIREAKYLGLPVVSQEVIDSLPAAIKIVNRPPYTLCHGDFGPSNISVKNDRLIIYDWELVAWASPARDLGGIGVRHRIANIDPWLNSYIRALNRIAQGKFDEKALLLATDSENLLVMAQCMLGIINILGESVETNNLNRYSSFYKIFCRWYERASILVKRRKKEWLKQGSQ